MSQHIFEGAGRFQVNVEADKKAEYLFEGLYSDFDEDRESIAGLRRRRRRASNTPANPIKTVSLIEEDGVLYWRDGIPARTSSSFRRGRRRGQLAAPDGSLVLAKEFPVLAPNKVIEGIGKIDRRLNPSGAVAGLVGIEGSVVSGVIDLESSGVEASDWRPRHDEPYHDA
jgi:hypothetical protein